VKGMETQIVKKLQRGLKVISLWKRDRLVLQRMGQNFLRPSFETKTYTEVGDDLEDSFQSFD